MTMTTLLKATRVIACLFVLVALFSCSDHRLVVGNERFRLKRADVLLFEGYQKTVYNYVADNRLASYEVTYIPDSPNPPPTTPDYTIVFSYNAQNRLIKADRVSTNPNFTRRVQVIYVNDNNGRIASATMSDDNGNTPGILTQSEAYVFEYGAGAYPTKVTFTLSKSLSPSGVSTLTYNNGNVVSITKSTNVGSQVTTSYTYDDKLNPYFGLVTDNVDYPGYSSSDFLTYSKNTRSAAYPSTTRSYNAKGLLVSESFLFNGVTRGSRYEYESY
jgi:hypothetical protein